MADKSLENYNDPKEYNDIGLIFHVTGKQNKQYDCHANTYRQTALNLVEQEFSNNVVDQYNQMIATRQAEMESAGDTAFSKSAVVQKAYVYYDTLKNHNTKDNINAAPSSLYMDVAIASAINKYEKEEYGAGNADFRSQGIARTSADYDKSFSNQKTGYIPPEKTIEYFDNLYAQNHMGSVKVDLKNKNDLAQYIQNADVHKGSRVVCDVEETKHDSSVVIAVKKDKQEGYDFYEVQKDNYLIPLKNDNPRHQSAIEKAQQAIENKELKVWKEKPNMTQLKADSKSIKVEYDYVLKETREYMYTGVNAQNEPTFSRLKANGGDLNVPLSELPITRTQAVIDHTKLCLEKAGQQFDNSMTLKPEDIKNYVPNLDFSYTLPENKAAQFDDPNKLQSSAKMVFENIYNEHNPEIKRMILAQNMKNDHERAMDFADNRVKAAKEVQETIETHVLDNENKKDPILASENNKNNNNPTKGILAMAQHTQSGRS